MMNFDAILRQVGEFGPYQKRIWFFVAIPAILVGYETFSIIFLFNIPPHRCAIPGFQGDTYHVINTNHTLMLNRSVPKVDGHWASCHVYSDVMHDVSVANGHNGSASSENDTILISKGQEVAGEALYTSGRGVTTCDRWVYDQSIFKHTIATDFDVVCHRSVFRPTSNMIGEIGALFGVFVCGLLADKYGRKVPFYIGGIALIGGGFGIAYTTDFFVLNVFRFILGFPRMAIFINGIVFGMEIVGPSKRTFTGLFIELLWCLGEWLILLLSYFIRQWRYMEIALAIPSIGLLTYWWLIPESPRWLASRGKEEEAVKILEKMAASNKTKVPRMEEKEELFESETKLTFRHVMASRELRIRMAIAYSNMFVTNMVYYGLNLNVTNLGGDIFINYLINVLSETIGFTVPYFLLDRVGRKPVYCTSIILAGIVCVISLFPLTYGAPHWVIILMFVVGKLCVCTAFAVIYVYGAELFPTVIRASAMGTGVTISRIGSFMSPYIADVGILVGGPLQHSLPFIVMGSPSLLVGFLSLWLPETKATKLPDTMEDLDNFSRGGFCGCDSKGEPDVREFTVDDPNLNEKEPVTMKADTDIIDGREITMNGEADRLADSPC